MESEIIIEVFLLILIVCSVSSAPRNMEADRYSDSIGNRQAPGERMIPRGNAKNKRNLWLKKNESLTVKFCQYEEGFVSVQNVLWSNDGWLDTVLVKLDDVVIGNFTTNNDTNWGFSWNKIHESGPVGSRVKLSPGEHTLTLVVVDGDRYGVEFDRIVLDVEGGQHDDDYDDDDDDGRVCPETRKKGNTTDNTNNVTDSVQTVVGRILSDVADNGGNITNVVKNNVDASTFALTTDKNGRNLTGLNRNDSSSGTDGDDVSTTDRGSNSQIGSDEDQSNDVTQRSNDDDTGLSSERSTETSGDVSTAKGKCREFKEYDFWDLAIAFWKWINRHRPSE